LPEKLQCRLMRGNYPLPFLPQESRPATFMIWEDIARDERRSETTAMHRKQWRVYEAGRGCSCFPFLSISIRQSHAHVRMISALSSVFLKSQPNAPLQFASLLGGPAR
jgi:hypothetical protein